MSVFVVCVPECMGACVCVCVRACVCELSVCVWCMCVYLCVYV